MDRRSIELIIKRQVEASVRLGEAIAALIADPERVAAVGGALRRGDVDASDPDALAGWLIERLRAVTPGRGDATTAPDVLRSPVELYLHLAQLSEAELTAFVEHRARVAERVVADRLCLALRDAGVDVTPPPSGSAPRPRRSRRGLVEVLQAIGVEIDEDQTRGNDARAEALGELARNIIATQGKDASPSSFAALRRFGEGFLRWRLLWAGAEFYKILYQVILSHAEPESYEARAALAAAGVYDFLGGAIGEDPEVIKVALVTSLGVLGREHPLTRAALQRAREMSIGITDDLQAAPWDMKPKSDAVAVANEGADDSEARREKLALWVTLAFMEVAAADGYIDGREQMVWKRTLKRRDLPDVWKRHGTPSLLRMLKNGVLQKLSIELSSLAREDRVSMGQVLKEIVLADGREDPREVEAMSRILGWLGLGLDEAS